MAGPAAPADLARLSLNQMTTERWSVREAVEGCARAGIPSIGLWRHKVAETGLRESARLVREAGLRVSSLCRGGMFTAADAAGRQARRDDNRRAVDEAAALNADVLVLVCGGMADRDLDGARAQVEEGIASLLPYAAERGVKLGIEPLHPAFASDRSVIVTLGQANDLVERFSSPWVGVVIDVYHVWWDPELYAQVERAAGHILGFHVDDWPCTNREPLMGRAMMGDGVIDLRRIRQAVDAAGYDGPIEVEIFNQEIWDRPGLEVLHLMRERYLDWV
ncbi:MAG TPA: sugar phosphate isomerase/epimerase family protein [Chloroflexota bacterium]|nr:sugar phosphate isomerase/epimerase family protein [Chloroflexota bacterium]